MTIGQRHMTGPDRSTVEGKIGERELAVSLDATNPEGIFKPTGADPLHFPTWEALLLSTAAAQIGIPDIGVGASNVLDALRAVAASNAPVTQPFTYNSGATNAIDVGSNTLLQEDALSGVTGNVTLQLPALADFIGGYVLILFRYLNTFKGRLLCASGETLNGGEAGDDTTPFEVRGNFAWILVRPRIGAGGGYIATWQVVGSSNTASQFKREKIYEQVSAVTLNQYTDAGDLFGIAGSAGVAGNGIIPKNDLVVGCNMKGFVDFLIQTADGGSMSLELRNNGSAIGPHSMGPASIADNQMFRYAYDLTIIDISSGMATLKGQVKLFDLTTDPQPAFLFPFTIAAPGDFGDGSSVTVDISNDWLLTAYCDTNAETMGHTDMSITTLQARQEYSRPN